MSTQLFDLTGRTALVTGSSRGLGRAMAEGLAAAGAALVLNGSDPERLAAAAAEAELEWAVGFIASGAIDVGPLLTEIVPFEDAVRAFELAGDRSRAMKVQLAL